MANEEQLSILKRGVNFWNKWRAENPHTDVDLSEGELNEANLWGINFARANLRKIHLMQANLSEASLREADISGANLSEANLNRADLRQSNFWGANLRYADISKAQFGQADLRRADLREVNLSETDLKETNFGGADLSDVKFSSAIFARNNFFKAMVGNTIFGNLDLSEAIELDNVIHRGPSSISTDTIALSKGMISEAFLRGCGLSNWEIALAKLYNPDLNNEEVNKILYRMYDLRAGQAIQISPLFISYSHIDSEYVDKLEKHLNKKGVRFWRDVHDMKSGRIETQVDRAIRQNPTVLLILSDHSLGSDWVEHEVRTARGWEKEQKRDELCP